MRIPHWIKNGAIILPAFFAGRIFHLDSVLYTQLAITVASFCLLSSTIYVVNDWVDLPNDRLHPQKRLRPLASGAISKRQAGVLAILLFAGGLVGCCFLPRMVEATLIAYLVLNLLYSFWLKNISLIDLSCVSAGFVLRLAAGGAVCHVPLSHWIIIITFLLSFSIALAKRRDDLVLSEGSEDLLLRVAQGGYSKGFIDAAKAVSFSVTLVAYILYTVSPEVMARIGSAHVYITALPVFLGIMRYLQLSIVKEATGSPVALLYKDVFLILCIAAWLGTFYYLIYC